MAWLGAIAYTLQIYFDFAGYSNMAIGLARIFGFHLSENFRMPYISKTVSEFWRRWHISLSSWFRDYVYIPIGGNRKGNVYFHLMIVFALTGLWHGASWNFILWGIWHGFFVITERLIKKYRKVCIPYALSWIYTMLVVVFGWVFFGAGGLRQGVNYIRMMFGRYQLPEFIRYNIFYYIDGQVIFTLIVGVMASMGIFRTIFACMPKGRIIDVKLLDEDNCYDQYQGGVRYDTLIDIVLIVLLIFDIAMIVNGNYSPFIYFRF